MNPQLFKALEFGSSDHTERTTFPIVCKGESKDAFVNVILKKEAEFLKSLPHALFSILSNEGSSVDMQKMNDRIIHKFNNHVDENGTSILPIIFRFESDNLYKKFLLEENPIFYVNKSFEERQDINKPLESIYNLVWNHLRSEFLSNPAGFANYLKYSPFIRSEQLDHTLGEFGTLGGWLNPIESHWSYDGQFHSEDPSLFFSSHNTTDQKFYISGQVQAPDVPLMFLNEIFNQPHEIPVYDDDYPSLLIGYAVKERESKFIIHDINKDRNHSLSPSSMLGLRLGQNFYDHLSDKNEASNGGPTLDLGSVSSMRDEFILNCRKQNDAIAALFSSSFNPKYRGIYDGALFIQSDSHIRAYGSSGDSWEAVHNLLSANLGTNYRNFYHVINLTKASYAHGFTDMASIVDIGLLGSTGFSQTGWAASKYNSLAQEFAVIEIATHRTFLISLGDHRACGKETWRSNSENRLDLSGVRGTLQDEYPKSAIQANPVNPLARYPLDIPRGQAIADIHYLTWSPALQGASILNMIDSDIYDDGSTVDAEDVNGLGFNAALYHHHRVRDYDIQKTKQQMITLHKAKSFLLHREGSLIKNVLNFNYLRIKYVPGSSLYSNPAVLEATRSAFVEEVRSYHVKLWCATHSTDNHLTIDSPSYSGLPSDVQSYIARFAGPNRIAEIRNPLIVRDAFVSVRKKAYDLLEGADPLNNTFITGGAMAVTQGNGNDAFSLLYGLWGNIENFEENQACKRSDYNLINIGDRFSFSFNSMGVPIIEMYDVYQQAAEHPHMMPLDLSWNSPIDTLFCSQFIAELNREIPLTLASGGDVNSNKILLFDNTRLEILSDSISCLPTIFNMALESMGKDLMPSESYLSLMDNRGNDGSRVLGSSGWARDSQYTVWGLKYSVTPNWDVLMDGTTRDILSLIGYSFGLLNLEGHTGHLITLFCSQKALPSEVGTNELVSNAGAGDIPVVKTSKVLSFHDLAKAISLDTGKSVCSSDIARLIIHVNKILLDSEFCTITSINPNLFTQNEKVVLLNRASLIRDKVNRRNTSLFIHDNYNEA